MKRRKDLFEQLTSFENLFRAFQKALRGKKSKTDCATFAFHQEKKLLYLQEKLQKKHYMPGKYRTFYVFEKKKRMISAADFKDRVVHHALCNILEPVFDPGFVYDCYANRRGKGSHAAVKRCSEYAAKYPYVLKCDIQKYFASIDHAILKTLIRKKIKDEDVLWLSDTIIDGSNEQEMVVQYFQGDDLFTPLERRRGLPIGNQTSQFFANIYLNPLDHFIKEALRCKAYVRYVDDFLLFGSSKSQLWDWGRQIKDFLATCRLTIHPDKYQILKVENGIPFLGYRIFPEFRLLPKENILRFRRRMRRLQILYQHRLIGPEYLRLSLSGWLGHAIQANTYHVRVKLFKDICFTTSR